MDILWLKRVFKTELKNVFQLDQNNTQSFVNLF